MKRQLFIVAVIFGAMLVSASAAQAQMGYGTQRFGVNRPTVSPYLNLLQPGGSGVTAPYQTLVRPLVDERNRAQAQQRQINRVQSDLSRTRQQFSQQRGAYMTGHPTRFMVYSHFYPARQ